MAEAVVEVLLLLLHSPLAEAEMGARGDRHVAMVLLLLLHLPLKLLLDLRAEALPV